MQACCRWQFGDWDQCLLSIQNSGTLPGYSFQVYELLGKAFRLALHQKGLRIALQAALSLVDTSPVKVLIKLESDLLTTDHDDEGGALACSIRKLPGPV